LDRLSDLNEQLVTCIREAHALEQRVLRLLDGMISTTDDPELANAVEHRRAPEPHRPEGW
jgi:ferritin-like metal-binding protein YciE